MRREINNNSKYKMCENPKTWRGKKVKAKAKAKEMS
jgi:hypothetical protein